MESSLSRRFALLAVAMVAVAAGCAIPTRDNLHDPASAPNAAARVVAYGEVGDDCPPLATTQPEDVLTTSHGRCLGIDASGSTDPQNDAISLEIALVTSGVEIRLSTEGANPALLELDATHAVLNPDFVRSLPLGEALFHLRARDSGGSISGTETVRVLLQNAQPIAIPDILRTLPAGGFPWWANTLETEYTITISGRRSRDPDMDPLRWCFTVDGDTPECPAPGVAEITRTFTADAHIYTIGVSVEDLSEGGVKTREVFSRFTVGEPNVWTGDAPGAPFNFELLDLRHTTYANPFSLNTSDNSVPGGSYDAFPILVGTTQFVAAVRHVSGEASGPSRIGYLDPANPARRGFQDNIGQTRAGRAVSDPSDPSQFWRLSTKSGGTTLERYVVDAAGVATAIETHALTLDSTIVNDKPRFLVTTSDTEIWAAFVGTSYIARELPVQQIVIADGLPRETLALARRPESPELPLEEPQVWALQLALPGTTDPDPATLLRLRATPTVEVTAYSLPGLFFTAMAFATENLLWIYEREGSLYLLDVALFENLLDADPGNLDAFASSIVLEIGVPEGNLFGFLPDPFDGLLWALTANGETAHITRVGATDLSFAQTRPLYVDPSDGTLWFRDVTDPSTTFLGSGRVPGRDAVVTRIPRAAPSLIAYDYTTGGVWSFAPSISALVRWAEDGTETERFSRTDTGALLPLAGPVAVDASGDYLWVVEQDAVTSDPTGVFRYRIDHDAGTLARDPATSITSVGDARGIGVAQGLVFSLAAPVTAGQTPDWLWTVWRDPGDGDVFAATVSLTTSGGFVKRRKLPTAFHDEQGTPGIQNDDIPLYGAARSLVTNRLCVGTLTTAGAFEIAWVEPTDVVGSPAAPIAQLTLPIALPSISTLSRSVAVTEDPLGGELCWAAVTVYDGGTCGHARLFAFDELGVLVHEWEDPVQGEVGDLFGWNRDQLWMELKRCETESERSYLRLRFDDASVAPAFVDEFEPANGFRLAHP